MVKHADESPIIYLNMEQLYWISIVDKIPPSTAKSRTYRTSIRVTFEHERHRHNPTESWQLWKDRRGTRVAHQCGGELQAVECVIEAVHPTYCGLQSCNCVTLETVETVSVDGFSVMWMARGYDGLECKIPVKFKCHYTDFNQPGEFEVFPVRLCVKTEMVQCEAISNSKMLEDATELCHCLVKLFYNHEAERQLWADHMFVREAIDMVEQQISREKLHPKRSANTCQTKSVPLSIAANNYDIKWHEKSWLCPYLDGNDELNEEGLQSKLQALEELLLNAKPVSYLNLPGDEQDDPDSHPVLIESELDGNHNGPEHSETSFWTGRSQNNRPPSMRSGSSSMNSSLHGTPTFDPEEQNPVFVRSPRPRLQKSSGYPDERSSLHSRFAQISQHELDGSSAYIPPRPPCRLTELFPSVDQSSSVAPAYLGKALRAQETVDAPPTLPPPPIELEKYHNAPFDCDICGEMIQVDNTRGWQ